MSPTFTDDEIDKPVKTTRGDRLGVVADVDDETAYVEYDPGVHDSIQASLDWDTGSSDVVSLSAHDVSSITSDAILVAADSSDGASDRDAAEARSSEDSAAQHGERPGDTDVTEPESAIDSDGERIPITGDPFDESGHPDSMESGEELESLEETGRRELETDPSELSENEMEIEIDPTEEVGGQPDSRADSDREEDEPDDE